MNSKRSMWKLLLGVASVGLLVTNCTLKTDTDSDDDNNNNNNNNNTAGAGNASSGECSPVGKKFNGCICAGSQAVSYQLCQADGTYGNCVCETSSAGGASSGGASSSAGTTSGGTSSSAGTTSTAGKGGAATANAGASNGDAGAAGSGPVTYDTCEDCLADRCQAEFDACDANPNCISTNIDGSGQYERIAKCINQQRVKGLVKRDVVRGCGVTLGVSADPDVISAWAPEDMDPVTTDLLNCMADAPGAQAASWANDDANYPVDGNDMINPTPWPARTCAKDACTSAL